MSGHRASAQIERNGLNERDFVEELMLMSENDGDCYRCGKDAELALVKAFRSFQKRRREEEEEAFEEHRRAMAKSLGIRWRQA